jgi:hypothetical protein
MTEFRGTESGDPAGPPRGALPYSYPPGAYPPPQYPQFPQYPQYPQFPPTGSSNGLAIAALVTGIVGLVTSPLCIGLGLGIAAVAMGVAARRRVKRGEAADGGGLALAGIVLGILATVVGVVTGAILAAIFGFGIATDQFNEDYQHCLGEHNGMAQYCQQYR